VFVDPDNEIEVPSKPVGRKGSSKYVTWSEIKELWKLDCSILIYQRWNGQIEPMGWLTTGCSGRSAARPAAEPER
jgi:hypothetical protein